MTFKVEITPSAERNIDEAVDWIIEKGSAQVAARWLDGLIEAPKKVLDTFLPARRLRGKGGPASG